MFDYLPTYVIVYLTVLVGLLGLVMGSALNCLAQRLASGQKWSGGQRSICESCGHVLSPLELIPLVSWLIQGGKCRHCGARVPARYPLTEAALSVVYISLLLRYGLTLHTASLLILCSCLFCLSLVDLDTQIIPDRFLIIPAVARLGELLLTNPASIPGALIPGLLLGGGVLALSLIMDKVLKKDTMGGGDIKLLALLGCFLPLPQCLLLLILACVLGIVIAAVLMKVDSETAFPFGPAISAAAWLTLLVGDPIVSWYLGLFL